MKEKLRQIDYVILFCVLGMTALSIVTLAGAANKVGSRYAIVQSIAALLGICVMFVLAYLDYDKLVKRFGIWIFVLAVLAMASVIVFGAGDRGNKSS